MKTAVAAAAATGAGLAQAASGSAVSAERTSSPSRELIDTNITLGRWPFRRLLLDETPALVAKLRRLGVTQAWAGSFDGLFHKDLAAANARLVEDCQRQGRGLLVPFGSVNVSLPGWEEDVRRCADVHKMPGIRLHPSYHGYRFDDPSCAALFALAREYRLVVQIVADMEDERTQHPLARASHVDFNPLSALLRDQPGLSIVLLNWFRSVSVPLAKQLAALGVCFDIATLEGVGGVANLVDQISPERAVFGSHAPLFYVESATLKLKESALSGEVGSAICTRNAERLLSAARPSS